MLKVAHRDQKGVRKPLKNIPDLGMESSDDEIDQPEAAPSMILGVSDPPLGALPQHL